jgi:hypothetical protein
MSARTKPQRKQASLIAALITERSHAAAASKAAFYHAGGRFQPPPFWPSGWLGHVGDAIG